jgi:hypothetical protein
MRELSALLTTGTISNLMINPFFPKMTLRALPKHDIATVWGKLRGILSSFFMIKKCSHFWMLGKQVM